MSQAKPEPREVAAGLAHAAIYPGVKKSAAVHRHSTSTEYRWRVSGPPQLSLYAANAPDKWRLMAHVRTLAKAETVDAWTKPQLIERYRALRHEIALAYAEILRTDEEGANQVDRAAADEKLAALLEERAAARIRLAAERISDRDIWGTAK